LSQLALDGAARQDLGAWRLARLRNTGPGSG
jgi:hypothetical protein